MKEWINGVMLINFLMSFFQNKLKHNDDILTECIMIKANDIQVIEGYNRNVSLNSKIIR